MLSNGDFFEECRKNGFKDYKRLAEFVKVKCNETRKLKPAENKQMMKYVQDWAYRCLGKWKAANNSYKYFLKKNKNWLLNERPFPDFEPKEKGTQDPVGLELIYSKVTEALADIDHRQQWRVLKDEKIETIIIEKIENSNKKPNYIIQNQSKTETHELTALSLHAAYCSLLQSVTPSNLHIEEEKYSTDDVKENMESFLDDFHDTKVFNSVQSFIDKDDNLAKNIQTNLTEFKEENAEMPNIKETSTQLQPYEELPKAPDFGPATTLEKKEEVKNPILREEDVNCEESDDDSISRHGNTKKGKKRNSGDPTWTLSPYYFKKPPTKPKQNDPTWDPSMEEPAPRKIAKKKSGRPPTYPQLQRGENGWFSCVIEGCDVQYKSPRAIMRHCRQAHSQVHARLKCDSCPREFCTEFNLLQHKDIVHNDGTGKRICDSCGERFLFQSSLTLHIKVVHTTSCQKEISCRLCDLKFNSVIARQHHRITEHPENIFQCKFTDCAKEMFTDKSLISHYNLFHNKEGILNCRFCDRFYGAEQSLSYHYDIDHDDEDIGPREFICDVPRCQRRFTTQQNLDKHIKSRKTGHQPPLKSRNSKKSIPKQRVLCNTCGVSVSKGYLDSHISAVHLKTKPLTCNWCEKKFETKSRLKRHKLRKHVRRELKCPQCSKVYHDIAILKQHIESFHQKIKHPCQQCNKVYAFRADLLGHIRAIHRGIKSSCSYCGKDFLRSSERFRHERSVHEKTSDKQTMEIVR